MSSWERAHQSHASWGCSDGLADVKCCAAGGSVAAVVMGCGLCVGRVGMRVRIKTGRGVKTGLIGLQQHQCQG